MEHNYFENSGKLIRIADSLETNATTGFLSVSGVVPKSVITAEIGLENIKKHYKEILNDYPTLRLKLVFENDIPYWYYATEEEIKFENLVKILDEPLEDEVPIPYNLNTQPLWRVSLTQFEEITKIKVTCSHCIIDGRAIFDLFDIFALTAINKEFTDRLESYKNQPVLYEYGKKDWYKREITDKKMDDPCQNLGMKPIRINPKVSVPSYFINPQWEVSYQPISKFCRKHNVTAQAILMAIQNEAVRNFNKDKEDDLLIPAYVPVDNRGSPFASELFKKCLFYTHVGFVMPFMEKEDNILENIKKCAKLLKENIKKTFTCDFGYYISNMRDKETGKMTFLKSYPDAACFSFASHLGLVAVNFDHVQFRSYNPISENLYWACFYGYHTNETFYFMYSIPYNCPDGFFESVKDTSMKYYKFILDNIKE